MRCLAPLVVGLLGGCVAAADLPEDVSLDPSVLCEQSIPPGEVETVVTGFDRGTRGIAFSPEGRLFVTHGDVIEEVFPDGESLEIASVPEARGLEWWGGRLAIVSGDLGEEDGAGGLFRLLPETGEPQLFVSPLPGAETATISPWRSLVVASPTVDEEVVEVENSGGLDGFVQEVPAPYGVGFSPDGADAWVSSRREDGPLLWRFPIVEDNIVRGEEFFVWDAPVEPSEVVVSTTDDAVYVALQGAGRIARVDPVTGEESDVGFGLVAPRAMALGTGEWDPCALYVASEETDEILAVGVFR